MKTVINILILLILGVPSAIEAAELSLFLFPGLTYKNTAIKLETIGRITGEAVQAAKIGEIIVDEQYYRDGYLTRQEIMEILDCAGIEQCRIYGNAVRITVSKPEQEKGSPVVIDRGGKITCIVYNKGIVVRVKGVAQQSGSTGDIITVEIHKKHRIQGRIIDKNTVESVL